MNSPDRHPHGLFRYRIFGREVLSDLPLPGLSPSTPGEQPALPPLLVLASEEAPGGPPVDPLLSHLAPTGEPWLVTAKRDGGYRLHFVGQVEFSIESDRRTVCHAACDHVPSEQLAQLLLNQVLPLVLNLQGADAFHATAVLTPRGACAFVGPSGAGKSTLAASFQAIGCLVLSDDCLLVEEQGGVIVAMPGDPCLRLWEDSAAALWQADAPRTPLVPGGDKHRLADSRSAPAVEPQPLHRIYLLAGPDGADHADLDGLPRLEPCQPREAFVSLLTSMFRLDITDRAMLARQFDLLHRVVALVPVRRLWTPHSFSSLPLVREQILADLSASAAPGRQGAPVTPC